ncbi:MAG: FtsX-like permease family protein, partial [Bacteroidales bacterium]|nr:FtsX-like permease family protein [Bacteroidales bacterium]
MALGACITDILRLVFGRSLRVAIPGLTLGLLVSIGLGWMIRSLLFGVTAWDPVTYLGVAILLTGVVLLACWIPARRATRIDPMEALRYE